MFDKFFKKKEETEETPLPLKALATLQQGNYPEALKLFNEYITMIEGFSKPLDSDDGIMYYNRSIAKEALNDKNGAISDLKKSVQLAEIHQAYFRLADLQSQTGDQQESIKNLVRAYELGSSDAEEALRKYTNYFNR